MNEPVFEVKTEFIEEETPTTAADAASTVVGKSPAKRKNSFRPSILKRKRPGSSNGVAQTKTTKTMAELQQQQMAKVKTIQAFVIGAPITLNSLTKKVALPRLVKPRTPPTTPPSRPTPPSPIVNTKVASPKAQKKQLNEDAFKMFIANYVDDGNNDSCLKVAQGDEHVEPVGYGGRAYCNKCNCFIEKGSADGGDDFFISNRKQHQCEHDKCAICQEHLGYMAERDKVDHIVTCQLEDFPTRNGRAVYLTDEHKNRRECSHCKESFSNVTPTVQYSYYRRHCISHVLPNPKGSLLMKGAYFYKCYYCSDGFRSKQTLISHLITHYQDRGACEECAEPFETEKDKFIHTNLNHKSIPCPSCNKLFAYNGNISEAREMLNKHYDNCCFEKVKALENCGLCGKRARPLFYKNSNASATVELGWTSVSHVINCRHQRTHQELKKTSAQQCLTCRRIVASNKSMRTHALLHVLPRDKLFFDPATFPAAIKCQLKCTDCENMCRHSFNTRAELAEHIAQTHFLVESCDYDPSRSRCSCNRIEVVATDTKTEVSSDNEEKPVTMMANDNDNEVDAKRPVVIKRPNILRSRRKL